MFEEYVCCIVIERDQLPALDTFSEECLNNVTLLKWLVCHELFREPASAFEMSAKMDVLSFRKSEVIEVNFSLETLLLCLTIAFRGIWIFKLQRRMNFAFN